MKTYLQNKNNLYVYIIISLIILLLFSLSILIPISLNQNRTSQTISRENKEDYINEIMKMIKQEIIEYTENLNSNTIIQQEDISASSAFLGEEFLSRYAPIHPNQQILRTSVLNGESQNEYFFVIKLSNIDLNNTVSFYLAYANSKNWELVSRETNLMDLIDFRTEYGSLNISMIDFFPDPDINGAIVVLRIVELNSIG